MAVCVDACAIDPTGSSCLSCINEVGDCCDCLAYAVGKKNANSGQSVCEKCTAEKIIVGSYGDKVNV